MWVYQGKAGPEKSSAAPAQRQEKAVDLRFSEEEAPRAAPQRAAGAVQTDARAPLSSVPDKSAQPAAVRGAKRLNAPDAAVWSAEGSASAGPVPAWQAAQPTAVQDAKAPDARIANAQPAGKRAELSAVPRRRAGQATRDCLLLAAAYLFGTALSGVMQSLCEARELDMLSYYLQSWGALFALRDARSAVALFSAQYFSAMGAVTLLLLFGLCAFGPVLIFLFTMLYGVGAGIVSLQLLLQHTLAQYAAYLVFWGVPAAAMAVCMCFFGSTALQVSVRLQHTAFGRRQAVPIASSARLLLGQYFLIGILLLPVCGVAAALLYVLTGL